MKRCDEAKLELLLGDKDREARRYQIYAGKKKRIKSSFPHPPRFFLLLVFHGLGRKNSTALGYFVGFRELQVQKLASFFAFLWAQGLFLEDYALPTACRFCWIDVSDCAGRTFHCLLLQEKNHLY